MTCLTEELDRYLTIRRSLGYDLSTSARVLRRFIAFAESQGAEHVSTDLFQRWQASFGQASRQTWAVRLGIVRLFGAWLHGLDPAHEAPPRGLIPSRARRPRPYIYSDEEIASIVNAAAELPSVYGLRGLTYATLFGLIAATPARLPPDSRGVIGDQELSDSGLVGVGCRRGIGQQPVRGSRGSRRRRPKHERPGSRPPLPAGRSVAGFV